MVADLGAQGISTQWDSEIVALISYLQRLGRDVGVRPLGPGASVSMQAPATVKGGP